MDRRWQIAALLGASGVIGLLGGCAAWLASDDRGGLAAIAVEEARLAVLPSRTPRTGSTPLSAASEQSAGALFAQPPAPIVRLDGVARTPGRAAALIAIGDIPARWLVAGSSADGVTVIRVGSGRATIDAGDGPRDIELGQTLGTPSAGVTPSAAAPFISDQAPAGRGLEPADAPGT